MDLQKFMQAHVAAREADIPVPALAVFFGKDEPAVWRVRGLTAAELARAREAMDRGENLKSLVSALAGAGDKAEAIKNAMGLSDDEVPGDISRRIEMLAAGSVSPVLGSENRDVAVKIAEAFPTTFYELTNKILSLTGDGAEVGKPKGSTRTKASG